MIASNGQKIAEAIEGGPDKMKELEANLGIVSENIKIKDQNEGALVKSIAIKGDPKALEAKSLVRKMNDERRAREA